MPIGQAKVGLLGSDIGKLELIETNDISSTSTLLLENLQTSTYNVHFLTYNNLGISVDNARPNIRFYENGVEESGLVYQLAVQQGQATGTFSELKNTADSNIVITGNEGNQTNEKQNGYIYFYNLGDSSKYSFVTFHNTSWGRTPMYLFNFGSGVLPQASTVDKIKFFASSGTFTSGSVSIYGIKE
jgi:hypothetical protein